MRSFVSGFFHSACSQGASVLEHVSIRHAPLWLINIALYGCTAFCLFIHPPMDTGLFPPSGHREQRHTYLYVCVLSSSAGPSGSSALCSCGASAGLLASTPLPHSQRPGPGKLCGVLRLRLTRDCLRHRGSGRRYSVSSQGLGLYNAGAGSSSFSLHFWLIQPPLGQGQDLARLLPSGEGG